MEKFKQRLFFAVWPQESARKEIAAVQNRLKPDLPARWVRPENLHMTLAFLGEVEPERLASLKAAADRVSFAGFELVLDQIEHWRRPQVLCLTTSGICEPLTRLAVDLARNLLSEGFELERRPFSAHLTLARKVFHPPAETLLEKPIHWKSSSFALVESVQDDRGSNYINLQAWPLSA